MRYDLNKGTETDWIIHDAESGDPYAHTWNEDDGYDLIQQLNNWQEVKRLFTDNDVDPEQFIDAISRMIQEESNAQG